MGVAVSTTLEQRAGEVLFTVTPETPDQGLQAIRDALGVYLGLSDHPGILRKDVFYEDPSVQMVVANVHQLHSQLALAQAMSAMKDATIGALSAAIYDQRLSASNVFSSSLDQVLPPSAEDSEPIVPGVMTLVPARWGIFQIEVPALFRRLRSRLQGRMDESAP